MCGGGGGGGGGDFDTCIFYNSRDINGYIDRQTGLRGPDHYSLLMMSSHFLFYLVHFLLILSFVLIITKISHRMAMSKSIHDVVDVQSLGSRHQMSMLHYWISYIRVTVHAALWNLHTALSTRHAAPSHYWWFVVLSNQYAVLNH